MLKSVSITCATKHLIRAEVGIAPMLALQRWTADTLQESFMQNISYISGCTCFDISTMRLSAG